MSKKIISVLFMVVLVFSFLGCAQWDDSIVGKWKDLQPMASQVKYWEFKEDGTLEIVFKGGDPLERKYVYEVDGDIVTVFRLDEEGNKKYNAGLEYWKDGRSMYLLDILDVKLLEKRWF